MELGVDEHSDESREHLPQALAGACVIERELGRGGMATIYLAHDRKHDRPVARKVLHPDLGAALGPRALPTPDPCRGTPPAPAQI